MPTQPSLEEVLATVARLEARVSELEVEAALVPGVLARVVELEAENLELRAACGDGLGQLLEAAIFGWPGHGAAAELAR